MDKPRMLITSRPGVCCVVGIRSPAILLSEDICEILDDQELEAVLTHEVAHIRHKDNLVGLIASMVRALAYYAPTMHVAMRHYMEERENAADDYVTESGGDGMALASGVVKVWRTQAPAVASPGSDAAGGGVVSRLERLVYTSGRVDPGSLPLVISITALLLAVILVLC
jgi:beta-lactamase regulating signal transducer with metallopeptidase domain